MPREGKLRVKLFVEGDTEENYFSKFRKNNDVEIIYKEVNMKGGGYTSFLDEVKKFSPSGFIAVFIVVDLDRFCDEYNQKRPFEELVAYCRLKNKSGKIPYFLIASNRDFEFFTCSHCPQYKNSDTDTYITKKFKYPSVSEFKADEKIYEFLNRDPRSFDIAINKLKGKEPYIRNDFEKKRKGLDIDIKIKKTSINIEALNYFNSNLNELFYIIGATDSLK